MLLGALVFQAGVMSKSQKKRAKKKTAAALTEGDEAGEAVAGLEEADNAKEDGEEEEADGGEAGDGEGEKKKKKKKKSESERQYLPV